MFAPRPLIFFPERNVREKIYPRPNVKNLIEEGVKTVSRRMLYTLCELNYTQTPPDAYWQKQTEEKFGIPKEQFEYTLKNLYTEKLLEAFCGKAGEINNMGFYRISIDGYYVLLAFQQFERKQFPAVTTLIFSRLFQIRKIFVQEFLRN